jgi:hypothetical protein
VESNVKVLLGGGEARTPAKDDPEAPVLAVEGLAVLGGIAVGTKAGPSARKAASA